jgi:hypothetical protein
VVLLVLAIGAAVAVVAARRRGAIDSEPDPRRRILAAQGRVHDAAIGYDVARQPYETSIDLARRWRAEHRVGREAERFAQIAQRAAFGGEVDTSMADEADRLSEQLIDALRASVDPSTRRTAALRGPWNRARSRGRKSVGRGRELVGRGRKSVGRGRELVGSGSARD